MLNFFKYKISEIFLIAKKMQKKKNYIEIVIILFREI